ncbi:MAG: amino acid ABC transporter substrate-binding protein [Candidatus Magasanikbacteria bacterium]|nr:amino acid ABC transporter substrate-binding protein [Candidatus Magasanikbacteria bacterium]
MNQSTKWIVGVIVVVAIVAVGYFVSLGPSGPVSTEPIKIGVILPLSGDLASVAEDVQKGINLFKKNHPDAEFIIENDEGDIKKSVSALKKLTELDNVHYILGPLGPVNSEAVYSAQSDSNKNKLTLIAWSMCADQFKGYGNMLCVYPSPYFQLKE